MGTDEAETEPLKKDDLPQPADPVFHIHFSKKDDPWALSEIEVGTKWSGKLKIRNFISTN